MLIFRWMIPALFVIAGILFVAFMFTGDPRYKRVGLWVLTLSLVVAFAFFGILIAINLME
jgi:bacteriorhodopsin